MKDLIAATLDDIPVPGPTTFFPTSCAYVSGELTDAEYESRATQGYGRVWPLDRAQAHRQIVQSLIADATEVARDHHAVFIGGMPGSGKAETLAAAGVDPDEFLTISPSIVEERLAADGLVPVIDGLTPLEAAPLFHAEAAEIALMLAFCAMRRGTNLLWDVTLSRKDPIEQRVEALNDAGYTTELIFADVDVETAIQRLTAEHRAGLELYRAGVGLGGRFYPPDVVRAHSRT